MAFTVGWDSPTQKRFHSGVDRGMLYVDGVGVPWSGLTKVESKDVDSVSANRYIDGQLYSIHRRPGNSVFTIEAYTYPDELEKCLGIMKAEGSPLKARNQRGVKFDLSYRTFHGDAVDDRRISVLHFVYNCFIKDPSRSNVTRSDSTSMMNMSFEVVSIPISLPGIRPTSYFTIDSSDTTPEEFEAIERVIYGWEGSTPTMPVMEN